MTEFCIWAAIVVTLALVAGVLMVVLSTGDMD